MMHPASVLLTAAGLGAVVYGVYLAWGTAAACIVGGLVLYTVGYNLLQADVRKREVRRAVDSIRSDGTLAAERAARPRNLN
jgi:hypothetical protein